MGDFRNALAITMRCLCPPDSGAVDVEEEREEGEGACRLSPSSAPPQRCSFFSLFISGSATDPTLVSNPSGRSWMKPRALEAMAAARTSSSVASGMP